MLGAQATGDAVLRSERQDSRIGSAPVNRSTRFKIGAAMTFGAILLAVQLALFVRWFRDTDVAIFVADTPAQIADYKVRGLLPAILPDAGFAEIIWNRDNNNIVGTFHASGVDLTELRRRLREVDVAEPPDSRLEPKLRTKISTSVPRMTTAENSERFAFVIDTATLAVEFWSPCGSECAER